MLNQLFINEIRSDQPGPDLDEYLEIGGPPGTSLAGVFYIVISDGGAGGAGNIEAAINLGNPSANPFFLSGPEVGVIGENGLFTVGEAGGLFADGLFDVMGSEPEGGIIDFENDDNVTHLLVTNFTGTVDVSDADTNDDGIIDVTFWDAILDSVTLFDPTEPIPAYSDVTVTAPSGDVPGHIFINPLTGNFVAEEETTDPGLPPNGLDTPGTANVEIQPLININEIRNDQDGPDDNEFLELAGEPNAPLNGLTYLVLGDGDGGSGVIEFAFTFTDTDVLDENGFYLAVETAANFPNGISDREFGAGNLNFENDQNATHLLVSGFTGFDTPGNSDQDLDTNDDGILDSEPWEAILDSVAFINTAGSGNQVYSSVTVGPDPTTGAPGLIFRLPDVTGNFQIGEFAFGVQDTPGATNLSDATLVNATIPEIQGDGFVSPLAGAIVATSGLVTALATNGFYLIDPLGDNNGATSDGIFINTGTAPTVVVGDSVAVSGTVVEAAAGGLSVTQISAVSNLEILSGGNALPAPILIGGNGLTPPTVGPNFNPALLPALLPIPTAPSALPR
ncbi:MAG: hypothetical protein HC890_10195 [Chloroflexaceae bacterium]|nr:hypothetical protein [Chloroflexaceae bacterium]